MAMGQLRRRRDILKILMPATGFCVALTACSAGPSRAETDPLAPYRWRHRPVLIFAPAPGPNGPDPDPDPDVVAQDAILKAAAQGLWDRDIAVFRVVADRVTLQDAKGGPAKVSADADTLRSVFAVAPDQFMVILVGKDGDEKLRQSTPLSAERLFDTIDAMPMRRREMRRRP